MSNPHLSLTSLQPRLSMGQHNEPETYEKEEDHHETYEKDNDDAKHYGN